MNPRPDDPTPEQIAQYQRATERMERDLARKISAWSRSWERCPLAGCRRNDRCLHAGRCRALSNAPWTEEDAAEFRRQLAAIPESDDGAP